MIRSKNYLKKVFNKKHAEEAVETEAMIEFRLPMNIQITFSKYIGEPNIQN